MKPRNWTTAATKQMIPSNNPANEGVAAPTTRNWYVHYLRRIILILGHTRRCANCQGANENTGYPLLDESGINACVDHRNRTTAILAGLHRLVQVVEEVVTRGCVKLRYKLHVFGEIDKFEDQKMWCRTWMMSSPLSSHKFVFSLTTFVATLFCWNLVSCWRETPTVVHSAEN